MKKFSIEKHRETAKTIYLIRDQVMLLMHELAENYGKTSRSAQCAHKLYKWIELLRNELDNRVCGENESVPDMQKIYFGGQPDQTARKKV